MRLIDLPTGKNTSVLVLLLAVSFMASSVYATNAGDPPPPPPCDPDTECCIDDSNATPSQSPSNGSISPSVEGGASASGCSSCKGCSGGPISVGGGETGSIKVHLSGLGAKRIGLLPGGMFRIHEKRPRQDLASPATLTYTYDTFLTQVGTATTAEGNPRDLFVRDAAGEIQHFYFEDGENWAYQRENGGSKFRLVMVDSNRVETLSPVYYELQDVGTSRASLYSAASGSEWGQFLGVSMQGGRLITLADSGIEIIQDANDNLSQVLLPQGLADIVIESDSKYRVDLHPVANIGTKVDGRYQVTGTPHTQMVVEYPEPGNINKLDVHIIKGSNTNTYNYSYADHLVRWSMIAAGGLIEKTTHRLSDANDNVRHDISETRNSAGEVIERITKVSKIFGNARATIEYRRDTGSGDIIYRSAYQSSSSTNVYAPLKTYFESPGGDWERHEYDAYRRPIKTISAFLDSPTNAAESAAQSVLYSYASLDASDTVGNYDNRPRTEIRKVLGSEVSRTYHVYATNDSQRVEVVERAGSVGAAYGAVGNHRTTTTYYPLTNALVNAGLIQSIEYSDGRLATYTYEYGDYNVSTNPASCSFTANPDGEAYRTRITYGTTNSPSGIANKTTRDVYVTDSIGSLVLTEVEVYTGSGYERVGWTVREFNGEARMVNEYVSNGTWSEVVWGSNCCGRESETDRSGIETTFAYDLLKRVTSKTKKGATTNDTDLVTSYTYDAAGHRLTTTVSGGALSMVTSSNTYDLAGRLLTSTDAQGITTTYDYSQDAVNPITIRAGVTNQTVRFADGRTHYTEQNGVRKQTYDYGVNPDNTQWTLVYTGPDGTNSPMWQKTTTDVLGRTIKTERPGFGGVVITNSYVYNAKGQLISQSSGLRSRVFSLSLRLRRFGPADPQRPGHQHQWGHRPRRSRPRQRLRALLRAGHLQ
jgi:YD repeat-containing protein